MSEQTQFTYRITSVDLAEWFGIKDKKVKKVEEESFELIDEDDVNYYALDCYTSGDDNSCWYNLHWKINDEKSDVDDYTSNTRVYKKLCNQWNIKHINTSSPFALASCGWDVEEDD